MLDKDAQCEHRTNCRHCGWNPKEAASRKQAIREGGLQKDKDGLKRLHVKTKEDIETDADCDL